MKFKDYLIYVLAIWALILIYQIPYFHEEPLFEEIFLQIIVNSIVIPAILSVIMVIIHLFFAFPSGKTFKVSKGDHRSVYRFNPFFNRSQAVFRIDVHKGLSGFIPHDQENKLVGMNWGLPRYKKINGKWRWVHPNSLRITTRSIPKSNSIVYSYYGYYKGKKLKNHSILIDTQDKNDYSISKSDLLELVRLTYGNESKQYNSFYVPSFGYYLFLFIGGKVPANREVLVTIYKYDKKIEDSWVPYYSLK